MAAPALAAARPRRLPRGGAPEIYFFKPIDNSRLVAVADHRRNREMAQFFAAVCLLFLMVMVYAWQHFSAIEYGYRIEAMKSQRDSLSELHRALRLEDASLRSPERIDALARQMGLVSPQAGQVQRLEPALDPNTPELARATQPVAAGAQ
jgi:cell division protein FtsL